MNIKRRSFLRSLVLGAAVAFPASRLTLASGAGHENDSVPSFDDLVEVGRIMDEQALPDGLNPWIPVEYYEKFRINFEDLIGENKDFYCIAGEVHMGAKTHMVARPDTVRRAIEAAERFCRRTPPSKNYSVKKLTEENQRCIEEIKKHQSL